MKKIPHLRPAIALSGLMFALNAAPLLAQVSSQQGAEGRVDSILIFPERSKDFGALTQGDEAWHDFEFEVRGEQAVKVLRVRASCGCLVPIVTAGGKPYIFGEDLGPGTRGTVRARLKTYEINGFKSSTIDIYTNSRGGANQLRVSATVQPYFIVNPSTLNFGRIVEGARPRVEASLACKQASSFEITAWGEAPPARILPVDRHGQPKLRGEALRKWEVEEMTTIGAKPDFLEVKIEAREGGGYTIGVRYLGRPPVAGNSGDQGAFMALLRFRTTLGRAITIRAQGLVVPLVGTEPSQSIAFGLMRRTKPASRTIWVVSNDPKRGVKVLSAELLGGEIKEHLALAKVVAEDDPKRVGKQRWKVEISTRETLPRGSFRAKIRIETDHPKYPVLEIPVTGYARG